MRCFQTVVLAVIAVSVIAAPVAFAQDEAKANAAKHFNAGIGAYKKGGTACKQQTFSSKAKRNTGALKRVMLDRRADMETRIKAAGELIERGNAEAITFVLNQARNPANFRGEAGDYFQELAPLLSKIGTAEAIDLVTQHLDRLPHFQIAAINALDGIESDQVIAPLLSVVKQRDNEAHVRLQAARVLSRHWRQLDEKVRTDLRASLDAFHRDITERSPQYKRQVEELIDNVKGMSS